MVTNPEDAKESFLEAFRTYLDFARILNPEEPLTANDWKLKNLLQFGNIINNCGSDNEQLRLMNENLHIPLGLPQPSQCALLEDYEEKLKVLKLIANTPFVQIKGQSPKRIDKGLISRFTWAAIWVTPLETMKKWEETIKSNEPLDFRGMIMVFRYSLPLIINIWRGRDATNSAHLQRRPPKRDAPRQTALQRDQSRCVLVGSEDPEVAHIYPHASILSAKRCSQQTESLMKLWGDKVIEGFMEEMNLGHIDVAENMISLNCLIHFWMDQVKIALEPVEERSDPRNLALRFRILQDSKLRPMKGKKSEFDDDGLELNQDPNELLRDLRTPTGEPLGFYARNAETGQAIRDGHLFYVRTDDPIARPLPSIRILQVHYRMSSMMRLAGAVGDDDDDDNDDDEPPEESTTTPISESDSSHRNLDPFWGSD
ncbi:hypothetical protein LX36DRAFT_588502 [Colletotrichum falcatum]|nr:hypothetical protein LX36DRAFT_588502 [Colletotrichum falcatum]